MKLTFTFTSTPNLTTLSKYEIFETHFQLPDSALQLSDVESRILSIAATVGELTQVCLHLTCRDLKWVNRFIKDGEPDVRVWYSHVIAAVAFAHYKYANLEQESRILKILNPIQPPRSGYTVTLKEKRLFDVCKTVGRWTFPPAYDDYLSKIYAIRDNLLPLLNSEIPTEHKTEWKYYGFFPSWSDNSLIKDQNKRRRAIEKERKQKEHEIAKASEKNKPKTGHIYFIQQGDSGAIKIGYSTDPEKRLRTLSTASPYPLRMRLVIEGNKKLEKELHDKFADCQLDGEWFEATAALLRYIEAHQG